MVEISHPYPLPTDQAFLSYLTQSYQVLATYSRAAGLRCSTRIAIYSSFSLDTAGFSCDNSDPYLGPFPMTTLTKAPYLCCRWRDWGRVEHLVSYCTFHTTFICPDMRHE